MAKASGSTRSIGRLVERNIANITPFGGTKTYNLYPQKIYEKAIAKIEREREARSKVKQVVKDAYMRENSLKQDPIFKSANRKMKNRIQLASARAIKARKRSK